MQVVNPLSISYTKNQSDERFINVSLDSTSIGTPNPVNADTLSGKTIDNFVLKSENASSNNYISLNISVNNASGTAISEWSLYAKTKNGYERIEVVSGSNPNIVEVEEGSFVFFSPKTTADGGTATYGEVTCTVSDGLYMEISSTNNKIFSSNKYLFIYYFLSNSTITLYAGERSGSGPIL